MSPLASELKLLDASFIEERPCWAILDATDTPAIPARLREDGVEGVSLYKGEAEESMWDIAPYLVRLDLAMLDWIRENLWYEPWGIVFSARASLEELRRHFRQFLLVNSAEEGQLYFRYYDPRVLAAFLPTCKDAELEQFFGPVESFWTRLAGRDEFQVFTRE